jgi:proline dehydrogenase
MKLPFALARRFVAAEDLAGTVPALDALHAKGLFTTLDVLGEYVKDRKIAEAARDEYVRVVETIGTRYADNGRDARNISIKLSVVGQKIDESFCVENLKSVLEAAKKYDVFVRLDMEGSDITSSTLSLFEEVYPQFPDNVGIVLQAYLKRTAADIDRMCELNARVRLCKGAYKEPASIAYQDMKTIRERFVEYMQKLLTDGRYPAIATHDDLLIAATREFVGSKGISTDSFEFQMLYGIRPATQEQIVNAGYRMRVYVPYGSQWYPYFSRRLRERKENVWFVLSNMFRQ